MNETVSTQLPEIEELPYCIQGTIAPAFRGESVTGEHLMCAAECGQMLIEQYDQNDYDNIGIKCFQCGEITRTPNLILGEVFAASTVTLGDQGAYLLGSTVQARSGVIITCNQEIAKEIKATAPRKEKFRLDLTEEGLSAMKARYSEIAEYDFAMQRAIVERRGATSIKKFPFVWAVSHIEKCLAKGALDIRNPETVTALMWLQMFGHVVSIWQHHPRFNIIAKDLGKPGSFLHTSAQLIIAAYLYNAGNRVGLSLENKQNEPNPDLYIRGVKGRNVFLEVKAPESLQWSGEDLATIGNVEASVKKTVKRSRAQINSSHRGALIVSSSYLADAFPAILKGSIERALKSEGRNRKSLAAVIGLSPSICRISNKDSQEPTIDITFQICVVLNKHYDGENPINPNPLA